MSRIIGSLPPFNMTQMNETKENEVIYQTEKTLGKIVKLSPTGWGFIISPSHEFTRIFFHWTALQQNTLNFSELKIGMSVKFYTQKYKEQGVRAYRIEVIPDE